MTRIVRGTDLRRDRSRARQDGRQSVGEEARRAPNRPWMQTTRTAAGQAPPPKAQWLKYFVVTEITMMIASTNGISLTIRQNFSERTFSPFSNFLREADRKPWKP